MSRLQTANRDAGAKAPDAGPAESDPARLEALEALVGAHRKLYDPRLAASTALDDSVQLHGEAMAKQLALLRDEVGFGQRLIFLEFPYSIYAVPDRSKHQLIQVWWRVKGYYSTAGNELPMQSRTDIAKALAAGSQYVAIESQPLVPIRAVDLIPRQGSLNVADRHDVERTWNLGGRLINFFGPGDIHIEKQRKQYEQFVHQDSFAAGFGKGARDFGWTFGPVPGTSSIAPGIKNTHALFVVPERTIAVKLEGIACYFPYDEEPPRSFADVENFLEVQRNNMIPSRSVHCLDPYEIDAIVPTATNNTFSVQTMDYLTGVSGQRTTVLLHGYFSKQVSVLVDGVPLSASPQGKETGSYGISGEFNVTSPNLLVLSFGVPANYSGTPRITLVAPGKVETVTDKLAGSRPQLFVSPFNLEGARLQRVVESGKGHLLLEVSGKGFRESARVSLNGRALQGAHQITANGITIPLSEEDLPTFRNLEDITIHVKQPMAELVAEQTFTFKNVTVPHGTLQQIRYRDLTANKIRRDEILLTVEGSNFTPDTRAELNERRATVMLVSPTKLIVLARNEGEMEDSGILRLVDSASGSDTFMPVADFKEQAHPKPAPRAPPRSVSLP